MTVPHITPPSDHARVHILPNGSGPYGKRETETEYGLIVDGQLVRLFPNEDRPLVFTRKANAHRHAQLYYHGRNVHIVHRGVTRDPFHLTTPYDSRLDV